MIAFIRSVFRHFKLADLGAILGANLVCLVPFLAAFVGPLVLKDDLNAGFVVLLGGFLLAGQALAVTGRVIDRRFRKQKREAGAVLRAWGQGWGEGLVITGLLIGLFSLVFQSVPFYWAQGTGFAVFSLVTLALGTLLVLGFLPYYLPARRREGLGLWGAVRRSFHLMNAQPLVALAAGFFGLVSVLASLGTFGLFPGFTGLAALHQGFWDHALEKEAEQEPGSEP